MSLRLRQIFSFPKLRKVISCPNTQCGKTIRYPLCSNCSDDNWIVSRSPHGYGTYVSRCNSCGYVIEVEAVCAHCKRRIDGVSFIRRPWFRRMIFGASPKLPESSAKNIDRIDVMKRCEKINVCTKQGTFMCIGISYYVHDFSEHEEHLYNELVKASVIHAASLSENHTIPLREQEPDCQEQIFIDTLRDVSIPLCLKSRLFSAVQGRVYGMVVTRISPPCTDDLEDMRRLVTENLNSVNSRLG